MNRPKLKDIAADGSLEAYCSGWEETVASIDQEIEEIKRVEEETQPEPAVVDFEYDGKTYQVELEKPLADDEELVLFHDPNDMEPCVNMYGVYPYIPVIVVKKTPNISPERQSNYHKLVAYLKRKKQKAEGNTVSASSIANAVWDVPLQCHAMPPKPKVRFIKE